MVIPCQGCQFNGARCHEYLSVVATHGIANFPSVTWLSTSFLKGIDMSFRRLIAMVLIVFAFSAANADAEIIMNPVSGGITGGWQAEGPVNFKIVKTEQIFFGRIIVFHKLSGNPAEADGRGGNNPPRQNTAGEKRKPPAPGE